MLLDKQYKKYKRQKQIVYNGSPIDVVAYTLRLFEYGAVSNEFLELVIKQSKYLMRALDIIYILPSVDESKLDDFDRDIEHTLAAIFKNYMEKFDKSPLFDHTNCPAIFALEEENKIGSMKDVIASNGELYKDDNDLIDMAKMSTLLKDNAALLESFRKGQQKRDIPLIDPNKVH